jgi:hypothetical protein
MNKTLISSTIVALLCTAVSVASAQQAFKTPDEAASALVGAAKAGDMKTFVTVLGPDGEDIVSSGDAVADAATRQKFVAAYDAKHEITMESDNKAVMVIGQEDFPLPIPLARKNRMWRFDTAAGREEILFRRTGRNELDAIQTCLAYVDAQNEYADEDRTGAGKGIYAQRVMGSTGQTPKIKIQVRLANSSLKRQLKVIELAASGRRSTVITTRSSRSRDLQLPVASWNT